MATAAAEIEFIPDEPAIEFIPDEPTAQAAVEFIPDEVAPSPELIAQEAQRGTSAALQAVDMLGIPARFDWSNVNERFDAERFREAESLRAQYTGLPSTPETRAMRERELSLRSQITPNTEAGRYLSRMGEQATREAASAKATEEAMRTPGDLMNAVLGPGLQSSVGPVAESFSQNAIPALGGVLSAAAYSTPQTGLAGMGIQMIASGMGTMTAAQGQEALLRSTETPEETVSRQQRSAQAEAEFPVSRFVGGALASAPYFRPSMDNIGKAVYGNRAALTNIGVNAAIGGAADAALAKLEGREIDPRSVGISALANVFLSEPTRLGRALGFQPTTPAEIAETAVYGLREVPSIPIGDSLSTAGEVAPDNVFAGIGRRPSPAIELQSGLETRGTTSTADVFANVQRRTQPTTPDAQQEPIATPFDGGVLQPEVSQQNEQLSTLEGGARVPEGGQREVVAQPAQEQALPQAVDPELQRIAAYNDAVDAQRVQRGLPPLMSEARKSDQVTWDNATRRIQEDALFLPRLIDDINQGRKDSVSDEEQAALLWSMVDLRNKRTDAMNRVADESLDLVERAQAKRDFDSLEQSLQRTEEADRVAGTKQGRALRYRRILANEDLTLAGMERRARATKGEPLTADEAAKISSISDKATKAQSEIDAIESAAKHPEIEQLIDKELAAEAQADPVVKSLADRIISALDQRSQAARQRLKEKWDKSMRLGAVPSGDQYDPRILLDVVEIAAAETAKGAVKFAQWSAKMVQEFGENIRPYLQPAWDQREKNLDEFVAANAGQQAAKVSPRVKRAVSAENQMQRIEAAIDARIKENGNLVPYVKKLGEQFIRSGITTADALLDSVHAVLSQKIKGITRERTEDLLSGRGIYTQLSKDPVKVTMRDLSGQMQQRGKLRDLANGIALKKTGFERRIPSAEERALIKRVNEAKRKFGVTVTDPATQLRSTQDAIRASLRNSIEDMALEIETGQPPSGKTPVEYTQDMEILRGIRDRVRDTLDFIQGPREITPEQRIAAERRALEASIDGYNRMLSGKEPATKKQPFRAKENEALRARRDALKAQLDELHAADAVLQENRKAEALVRQIEAAEAQLAAPTTRGRVEGPESQLVSEARAQLAAVREQISTQRANDPARQREAIDRAERSVEKAIAKLDSELQAGDIAVRQKKPGITSDRLEYLRAQKAAMVKLRQTLRNEAKPRMDVEELAIRQRISQLARNEAQLRQRIADEDFEPRSRKDPRDFSERDDYVNALAKRDEAKRDFERMREAWEKRNRTPIEKVIDGAKETWRAARNLKLSFDLSAPIQNAKAMAAHPIIGAKALGKGFRALGSTLIGGNYAKRVEQEIANSPNNKNGLYRAMGLDLSEITGQNREENAGSVLERLAELETRWRDLPDAVKGLYGLNGKELVKGVTTLGKLPFKLFGLGIKASNAGFGAVSNYMRARTADAVLDRMMRRRSGQMPSKEELQLIGNEINSATGKGGLRGGEGLRALLFAPNYYLSILKQLSGQPLFMAAKKMKGAALREISEEYVRALATAASVVGLGYLFFGENNPDMLDPRSSQFGRVITDQGTTVDPTMGRGAWLSLVAQLKTGEMIDRNGRIKNRDQWQTLMQFVRGRLSPEITSSMMALTGEDFFGNELTPEETMKQIAVPLGWQEFDRILENEGLTRASFLQLLNFIGVTSRPAEE